jgi:septum formation protein
VEELERGEPRTLVVENARRKAAAIARDADNALVLGVDTVVVLDGRVYGKPAGVEQAREVLSALSGRRHEVLGGICLIDGGRVRTAVASTAVEFRTLEPEEIESYLDSGEWRDRAGGYAIQGRGAALVRGITGDYLNVVGLPVATLLELEPEIAG